MRFCDHCGTESDDASASCVGCGAVFQPPVLPAEPPAFVPPLASLAPPYPRSLNGAAATIVLLIYLGAQFAGGIVAGFFGGIVMGLRAGNFSYEYRDTMQAIMPWTILLVMIFGWVAMIVVVKTSRFDFKDTSATGPAWVRGSWVEIAKGLAAGILLALLWSVCNSLLGQQQTEHESSPMTTLATTPGLSQLVWVFTAIALAPPVEELLFRGILYGGYRKSLGHSAAAALTTFIFVLLHITELVHEPVATFAIGGLALLALWRRLRSNAIGPAIAVHMGYNSVIALAVIFTT